jgi:flagellar basal-body rod modification protein FlgD
MSAVALVQDGKIVSNSNTAKDKPVTHSEASGMDKESFLQLLVAQMKYQDPLEPQSNTEYVSQYAQFSQVEQIQNMASNMSLQRASSLVGQEVYMNTKDANGNSTMVKGKVDYVVYQGGDAFLAINENLYPLEDLNTVADGAYTIAYDMATDLVEAINKLPALNRIDLSQADHITAMKEFYDHLTPYQKTFVAEEKVAALESYVAKIEELQKIKEETEANADSGSGTDPIEGSEPIEGSDPAESSEPADGNGSASNEA